MTPKGIIRNHSAFALVGAALAFVSCEKTMDGVSEDANKAVEAAKVEVVKATEVLTKKVEEAKKEADKATEAVTQKATEAVKETVNEAARAVEAATAPANR
jgi:hypothetical protein